MVGGGSVSSSFAVGAFSIAGDGTASSRNGLNRGFSIASFAGGGVTKEGPPMEAGRFVGDHIKCKRVSLVVRSDERLNLLEVCTFAPLVSE